MKKDIQHIAIICDGNGRWAKQRGLSRSEGHKFGIKAFDEICKVTAEMGIPYLTVYAFSTENWSRSKSEVQDLMNMFSAYIQACIVLADKSDLKFRVLGSRKNLSPQLIEEIDAIERLTRDNQGVSIQVALNYGGRDELVRVMQTVCAQARDNSLESNDFGPEIVERYLDTIGIPDPDILIRTGGEKRLSNFLLWQCAYSELFFENKYWPDFDAADLNRIIGEFKSRTRKFGAVNE